MGGQPGNRSPGGHSLHGPGWTPLSRGLSLDPEVGRADQRINAPAGVRPGTDTSLTFNRRRLAPALARPDELAQGADFVPGHNLIDFDPPHLSAANPNLRQLQLPMWERKTPRCNRPGRLPDRFHPRGPRNGRPGALRVLATPPAPGAVLPPAAPSSVRPGSPVQVRRDRQTWTTATTPATTPLTVAHTASAVSTPASVIASTAPASPPTSSIA